MNLRMTLNRSGAAAHEPASGSCSESIDCCAPVVRLTRPALGNAATERGLDPYLDPYRSCLMCLMRLFLVLGERG